MRVAVYTHFHARLHALPNIFIFQIEPVGISVNFQNSSGLFCLTYNRVHIHIIRFAPPQDSPGRVKKDVGIFIGHRFEYPCGLFFAAQVKIGMHGDTDNVEFFKNLIRNIQRAVF